MALPNQNSYISPDEYLELERKSGLRYEYVAGEVYAMSGGSWNHSLIISNTNRSLGNQLDGKVCTSLSSDMRLHVASAKAYRYPDVMVVCGEPQFREDRSDIITNPIVLIEVLSQSTLSVDHIEKKYEYFQIPSLREYLLISQDKPQIESYLRKDDDSWLNNTLSGLDTMIDLLSINCSLTLSAVYQKVTFDSSSERGE